MLKVRWPYHARCRAFLADISSNLARLDVYSSVSNNDEANHVVAFGPSLGPAFVTLLPDLTFSDLEYFLGAQPRLLSTLQRLPQSEASGDVTVSAPAAEYIRVYYDSDERSVVWAFGPDEDVMQFTHVVHACQGTVHLLFAQHDRWSGVLFTDLIFDDSVTAIEAWRADYGWNVDPY